MTDQTFAPTAPHEPELKRKPFDPKGVMQKNGKAILFLGVAALLLVARFLAPTAEARPRIKPPHSQALNLWCRTTRKTMLLT